MTRKYLYILNKTFLLLIGHMEGNMQWILTDLPLGRNIQKVRVRRNLTQEEIVARMQLRGSAMSRSTLANIETGRRNIKANDLKLLKLIFDVEYDEFFQD